MIVPLADGGRVSVVVEGNGPPLLLVRPLGGSVASWEPFAGCMAAKYRVVMFDARGTGCSSVAPLNTTTRLMAHDAVAVLDAVGIPRAHVYGLSLGGMVASWLAIDAPARVGRLVLASTPIRGGAIGLDALRRGFWMLRCLARPPRAAEACLATRILSPGFRAARPDAVRAIQAQAAARPASHRGLVTLLAAAARHDVRRTAGAIGADVLVIAGGCDRFLGTRAQSEFAAQLPRARFVVVEDAGHDVSTEAPAAVARLVSAHVSGG